jgi:ataxia telangiectasia mutated family protein
MKLLLWLLILSPGCAFSLSSVFMLQYVVVHFCLLSYLVLLIFMQAGLSNAHQVIFHLPTLTQKHPVELHSGSASKDDKLCSDYGISDDILVGLLKLLMTYLSDESVEIIDAASQTLRVCIKLCISL